MTQRCRGTTRAGKPCSITRDSSLTNDGGRLAAEPLRRGGAYCLFHAKPFCTRPTGEDARNTVAILLDLETTGVDTTRDRVVEIAALHCPADPRFFGGAFSTVVRVAPEILVERGPAATAVHGISDEEVATGPDFPVAWRRFLTWTDAVLNAAVLESPGSDDDAPFSPRLLPEPVLVLAGHNAFGFDFPVLLAECLRHGLACECFRRWLFADTLQVSQTLVAYGCRKLQCMVRTFGSSANLRAHRALDDCVALRHVGCAWAELLGEDLPSLLRKAAFEVDLDTSLAQLSVLMDL